MFSNATMSALVLDQAELVLFPGQLTGSCHAQIQFCSVCLVLKNYAQVPSLKKEIPREQMTKHW